MDIHEQHIDYLRRCHAAYQILCQKYGWRRVECIHEGAIRSIHDIANVFCEIQTLLATKAQEEK